jgi:hypothetical protein
MRDGNREQNSPMQRQESMEQNQRGLQSEQQQVSSNIGSQQQQRSQQQEQQRGQQSPSQLQGERFSDDSGNLDTSDMD